MDEHDKRAREVSEEIGAWGEASEVVIAAALRAAVAAERERCVEAVRAEASDLSPVLESLALTRAIATILGGVPVVTHMQGVDCPECEDGEPHQHAPVTFTTKTKRVSERYDPDNPAHQLGATTYEAVIDALAKHDAEGMPHKWDKVAAQAVEHAVREEAAAMLASAHSRIAARLRARADEEWSEVSTGASAYAADVLRSEADALEGT